MVFAVARVSVHDFPGGVCGVDRAGDLPGQRSLGDPQADGTEAGATAILSSFGAEAATGQIELIVIEAAILGIVLSGKAIAHKKAGISQCRNRKRPVAFK